MKEIKIGKHTIGKNHEPFLIAEMSGNHNQSLDRALKIVDAAAESGAHAIKLQTYTADTMTLDLDSKLFKINDESSLWYGKTLYNLYEEAHTPWEWHEAIFKRAEELGIVCLSTPFDHTAVDFLEKFDPPVYKVASFENTDVSLIRKVAQTGKPVIISTGMAGLRELELIKNTFIKAGGKDLILLKCTSSYPAEPVNANVMTIPHMSQMLDLPVGLSDHTLGIGVPVSSIALGVRVIEKHFTLSRADGGVDSAFSLEPAEFKSMAIETKRAWQSLGKVRYGTQDAEEANLKFRRSIFVVKDINKGEVLNEGNVRCIRPGYGMSPEYIDEVIGKCAAVDLKKGEPLKREHFN